MEQPTRITNRPTTTTEKDFSYWDDIPPLYHYPVHLTDTQVSELYDKLNYKYKRSEVEVFGLVGKYMKTDDKGDILIYDTTTDKLERRIHSGHEGAIKKLDCWKGDIVHITSAGSDGTVRIFNFETGKYLRRCQGHEGPINCLRVSEDEDIRKALVCTGGKDCTVRLFYLVSGKPRFTMEGHKYPIIAVDFMDCMGGYKGVAVSVDTSGEIKLWNRESGELLRSFQGPRPFFKIWEKKKIIIPGVND